MKRIRPYYIGLIVDLLYIVIIISQWQKWFVGVARFNSHKFFLIMYICLAILYRISFLKILSNRIITWNIRNVFLSIKSNKARIEIGFKRYIVNLAPMILYLLYKFLFLFLSIGFVLFYSSINIDEYLNNNNIFLIGGLIAIYIVASYMHFYVLLSQNIYIDTVWIMLLEVIVLGVILFLGLLDTSMWGLVTAIVVIINSYLSEDIWKITRYSIVHSKKFVYQKRFIKLKVLVNILVFVLFILLALFSPQSIVGKFIVTTTATNPLISLGFLKFYILLLAFIIIYPNIEGITTFFVELLYKEDKTVEFYKKIKGKYQRVEKDIRGKDELTYSEPIVKIKNGKIYSLTHNQDKFLGYEIDLENKQIIFDDGLKLQFSFDDFNDELLIADKRYKKMKPTFNN